MLFRSYKKAVPGANFDDFVERRLVSWREKKNHVFTYSRYKKFLEDRGITNDVRSFEQFTMKHKGRAGPSIYHCMRHIERWHLAEGMRIVNKYLPGRVFTLERFGATLLIQLNQAEGPKSPAEADKTKEGFHSPTLFIPEQANQPNSPQEDDLEIIPDPTEE